MRLEVVFSQTSRTSAMVLGSIRTWLEGQLPEEALIDQLGTMVGASSGGFRREVENHPLPSHDVDTDFAHQGAAARFDRGFSGKRSTSRGGSGPDAFGRGQRTPTPPQRGYRTLDSDSWAVSRAPVDHRIERRSGLDLHSPRTSHVALAGSLLKPPRKDAVSIPEKGRDADSNERMSRWCYLGMLGNDA